LLNPAPQTGKIRPSVDEAIPIFAVEAIRNDSKECRILDSGQKIVFSEDILTRQAPRFSMGVAERPIL
jgi:hypothetical protein